jgi:hypothetical protein
MVALNVVLMAVIIVAIAGALAWAIVSDRRSKRAASRSDAPLHEDLTMPRDLRNHRMVRVPSRRKDTSRPPVA